MGSLYTYSLGISIANQQCILYHLTQKNKLKAEFDSDRQTLGCRVSTGNASPRRPSVSDLMTLASDLLVRYVFSVFIHVANYIWEYL